MHVLEFAKICSETRNPIFLGIEPFRDAELNPDAESVGEEICHSRRKDVKNPKFENYKIPIFIFSPSDNIEDSGSLDVCINYGSTYGTVRIRGNASDPSGLRSLMRRDFRSLYPVPWDDDPPQPVADYYMLARPASRVYGMGDSTSKLIEAILLIAPSIHNENNNIICNSVQLFIFNTHFRIDSVGNFILTGIFHMRPWFNDEDDENLDGESIKDEINSLISSDSDGKEWAIQNMFIAPSPDDDAKF